jgi:hypothetical protein
MHDLKDIIQLVTNGGAVVMLVLVAIGLYRIARDIVPAIRQWLKEDTAVKLEWSRVFAALEAKVDAAAVGATRAADQATVSLGHVRESVSAEARDLSTHIDQAERRITAAVRREHASDPPSSSPAPATRRPLRAPA